MTEDLDGMDEGLTISCPSGHIEWMHPEMLAPPTDPFFCGECGHVFGTWGEVHERLFAESAGLLNQALSRPR